MEYTLNYKNKPLYSVYKKRSKTKFPMDEFISKAEFEEISSKNCHYCGTNGPNGIDRYDNSIGYIKDNCVPCCKHCNYAKGALDIKDFRLWIKRIVFHNKIIKMGKKAKN